MPEANDTNDHKGTLLTESKRFQHTLPISHFKSEKLTWTWSFLCIMRYKKWCGQIVSPGMAFSGNVGMDSGCRSIRCEISALVIRRRQTTFHHPVPSLCPISSNVVHICFFPFFRTYIRDACKDVFVHEAMVSSSRHLDTGCTNENSHPGDFSDASDVRDVDRQQKDSREPGD